MKPRRIQLVVGRDDLHPLDDVRRFLLEEGRSPGLVPILDRYRHPPADGGEVEAVKMLIEWAYHAGRARELSEVP